MVATCLTTYPKNLLSGMSRLGLPRDRICRLAGLDPNIFEDPRARVPLVAIGQMWKAALDVSGERHLGPRVGAHMLIQAHNFLVYAMMASETLGQAFTRGAALHRYVWGAEVFGYDDITDPAWLCWSFPAPDELAGANHAECVAVCVIRYASWFTGRAFRPLELQFRHAPLGRLSEYKCFFACPVRFRSAEDRMAIPCSVLRWACTSALPKLARLATTTIEQELANMDEADLLLRTKWQLTRKLEGGPPSLGVLAQSLGISSRTLERRLHDVGWTYRGLLDSVRRDVGLALLEDKTLSKKEIAYRLGYHAPSAFTRALRRWTDAAPLRSN